MTLRPGERLVLKRFIDEAPEGWSARAIAAAADIDGATVEIVQIERGGQDVLARKRRDRRRVRPECRRAARDLSEDRIVTDLDALTCAVLAVALAPFAYWELGHRQGVSDRGSSPWLRRAFVLGWLGAIVAAVYGVIG